MIPEEMRDFISQEGGNSLIIQGKPGAGKTIPALELMDMFPDHNPIYLTTRSTTEAVYRYFPRLRQRHDEISIIESKNTFRNRFFKKFDDKILRVEREVSRGYNDVRLTLVR